MLAPAARLRRGQYDQYTGAPGTREPADVFVLRKTNRSLPKRKLRERSLALCSQFLHRLLLGQILGGLRQDLRALR